jgi:hypothetical protein
MTKIESNIGKFSMLNMRYVSFVALIALATLFSGCSGKQYYKPAQTYSVSSHSYGGKIIDLTYDGATLESGRYIGKGGVQNIHIGEGYRFLIENSKYVLSSN